MFNSPLVWTDELAAMIFLWLAMLGAVLALWNGEHMRLTTLSSRLQPRWRAFADTLAVAAPCLFLIFVIGPALDYVQDQSFVETPALGWPDSMRAAALPAGCGADAAPVRAAPAAAPAARGRHRGGACWASSPPACGSRQARSSRLAI